MILITAGLLGSERLEFWLKKQDKMILKLADITSDVESCNDIIAKTKVGDMVISVDLESMYTDLDVDLDVSVEHGQVRELVIGLLNSGSVSIWVSFESGLCLQPLRSKDRELNRRYSDLNSLIAEQAERQLVLLSSMRVVEAKPLDIPNG